MTDPEFESAMGVDGELLNGMCIPTQAQWEMLGQQIPAPELPPEPFTRAGATVTAFGGVYL